MGTNCCLDVVVPQRRLPPRGHTRRVDEAAPACVGIRTYSDMVRSVDSEAGERVRVGRDRSHTTPRPSRRVNTTAPHPAERTGAWTRRSRRAPPPPPPWPPRDHRACRRRCRPPPPPPRAPPAGPRPPRSRPTEKGSETSQSIQIHHIHRVLPRLSYKHQTQHLTLPTSAASSSPRYHFSVSAESEAVSASPAAMDSPKVSDCGFGRMVFVR